MFSFVGDTAAIALSMGPNRGIAGVRIDGVDYPSIDLYAPSYYPKSFLLAQGLGSGTHLVEIVVTGNKNAASSGNVIVVDSMLYK
jgi:hypothetical protein